jgi:hypothetical protein
LHIPWLLSLFFLLDELVLILISITFILYNTQEEFSYFMSIPWLHHGPKILCVLLFKKKFLLFIYSHLRTLLGSFLPPPKLFHHLPNYPPHFQAETVLPLSLILLKRRYKYNKEDKVFLIVKLRIAIPKYS